MEGDFSDDLWGVADLGVREAWEIKADRTSRVADAEASEPLLYVVRVFGKETRPETRRSSGRQAAQYFGCGDSRCEVGCDLFADFPGSMREELVIENARDQLTQSIRRQTRPWKWRRCETQVHDSLAPPVLIEKMGNDDLRHARLCDASGGAGAPVVDNRCATRKERGMRDRAGANDVCGKGAFPEPGPAFGYDRAATDTFDCLQNQACRRYGGGIGHAAETDIDRRASLREEIFEFLG